MHDATNQTGTGVTARAAETFGLVEIADLGAGAAALALPPQRKAIGQGALTMLWVGPRRWHAVAETQTDLPLIEVLRARCQADAVLVDLSDARRRTRLSGTRARTTLAAGTTLDLRDGAFGPGDCVPTLLGKIPVVIHARMAEVFDLYCDRSLERSLASWLVRVGAEHGCRILSQ